MPKSDLTLTSGEYSTVAERIALFYGRHPTGRIITHLVSREKGEVVMKASVYRTISESRPSATGWAAEREGDGDINTVACLENTETSAVGRALANLGFAASSKRPSLEEMIAAARRRARTTSASNALEPRGDAGVEPSHAKPPDAHTADASRSAGAGGFASDPLHRQADEVMDLLDLLRAAERLGFSSRRADVFRRHALAGDLDHRRLAQLTHQLRVWSRRAATRSLLGGPPRPQAG